VKIRLTALLACSLALSACGGVVRAGAMADMQELYAKGECAQLLQSAGNYSPFIAEHPALVAEASFLRANCLAQMGRQDEAVELFRYVSERHPESPYAYQSRALIKGYSEPRECQCECGPKAGPN
jgi:tetratricopeptide (TPR) repeat protein